MLTRKIGNKKHHESKIISKKNVQQMQDRSLVSIYEAVGRFQDSCTRRSLWQIANSVLPYLGILVVMYWSLGVSLWLTIGTGIALGLLEAGPSLVWFHQGRGLATLAKLGLLCAVPFCWDQWGLRLAILLLVVIIASVGSHMPARLRYYSVIYKEVLRCGSGPGTSPVPEDVADEQG